MSYNDTGAPRAKSNGFKHGRKPDFARDGGGAGGGRNFRDGGRGRPRFDKKGPRSARVEEPLAIVDPADHSEAFKALGVPVGLLDALVTEGIRQPFPVQTITLPDALAGRDVCGRAPTGSGKTLAYGLAVLARIEKAQAHAPKALILVPTRELAKQVAEVLHPYSRVSKRWVTAFFGGAGMGKQISELQRGVDVAVATPGRLIDLLDRGEVRLNELTMIVIDEADRMADMGFTPQVARLLAEATGERQVLLYSATLDGDVDSLVKKYMHDPVVHHVGGDEGEDELEATKRARHIMVPTKFESKYQDLAALLSSTERSIVFVKNRFGTERAAAAVETLGVTALAMHGGLSQNARETALKRWAKGEVVALFATDVAARGVHVSGVEAVVHMDPPQDEKDYIHRSGRTARAGAHGLVVNLFRKEQIRPAQAMFRRLGVAVESVDMARAQEMVGEIKVLNQNRLDDNKVVASEIWTTAEVSELDPEMEFASEPRNTEREWRPKRTFERTEHRSFDRPTGGERPRSFEPRGFEPRHSNGDRDRSFGDSASRGGFAPRGDRPAYAPRGDREGFAPRGDRPAYAPGGDRPGGFAPRGDRPGFAPRGDREGFAPRGDRPAYAPRGDRPGGFAPRGDRPGFAPRGDRPAYAPRGDREGFAPRGDRPAYAPRGDRPGGFAPRGDRPDFAPRGDRPDRGFNRDDRGPRPDSGRGFEGRPSWKGGASRADSRGTAQSRPAWNADRPARFGGDDRNRPFTPRDGGDRPAFRDARPGAPRSDRPDFASRNDRGGAERGPAPKWSSEVRSRPGGTGGFRSN